MLAWPTVNPEFVSEFTTEGYLAKAFPTLFQSGECDYLQPRITKIPLLDFYKHLMHYKDGRFAMHASFPFFALNSFFRHRALAAGKFLFRKSAKLQDLTVKDIKDQMKQDHGEELAKSLIRLAECLKGTKAYWNKERKLLRSMISQIGCPSFFYTLSAADLSWPELHHLLPLNPNEEGISKAESYRRSIHNLSTSPQIVAEFLARRSSEFTLHICHALGVDPKHKMKDYWLRFEWQSRGSGHIHGFLWIEGGPVMDELNWNDPEAVEKARRFFDGFVTAMNPALGRQKPAVDCIQRPLDAESNLAADEDDYADLCNRCQRHGTTVGGEISVRCIQFLI